METPQAETASTVGIVGGGKVGLQLLHLFSQSRLTRVTYVVDKDAQAPAMAAARKLAVTTFLDLAQALAAAPADFVFEVTGSAKVVEGLRQALADTRTQLVTHDMAFVLLQVIEENRQRATQLVRADMVEIKQEIASSLKTMAVTIDGIKEMTGDLRYLALNARIEAARAGEHGRGFDIVAQQVEKSAQTVRDMAQEIAQVNAKVASVSERIEASLQKLD
jgi:methyl-accepting chemotaxis protein